MNTKTAEELYASLQRGMQAATELQVVKPLLEERKAILIQDAIYAYNSKLPEKRLTERDAMLFVAALAENQHLLDDLDKIITIGRRDGDKLSK